MSFIVDSPDPPECKEDDVLPVEVLNVEVKTSDKYTDDEGIAVRQLIWKIKFANGYKTTMYGPRFYERNTGKNGCENDREAGS